MFYVGGEALCATVTLKN